MTADEVRALRQRLGLTQEQLARRLNCTTMCVSRWERGASRPSRLATSALEGLANEVERKEMRVR